MIIPNPAEPAAAPLELATALSARRAAFIDDFAAGIMGRHHNTYQHRARVLRQMDARLALARTGASTLAS